MGLSDMNVPERVHIMPLGYERDRITEAARRLKADRVVLLDHVEDEDDRPSYHSEVLDELQNANMMVDRVQCNIFDLYESLGTIAELVTQNIDDDVYVNLATGSKVTAIGGMIACMATNATPYYVRAETYGDNDDQPVSEGVRGINELPAYPIDKPSPERVAMLEHIADEREVSKKSLIEFGEMAELPFLEEYDSEEMKGKYRLLDSRILDPLEDQGYVEVTEVGRKKYVSLTSSGANTLEAFRYLLKQL